MLQTDIKEIAFGVESIADKLSGKTVLITGGRGFLGDTLLKHLIFLTGIS